MRRRGPRERISLKPPPERPHGLKRFPMRTLRQGKALWRVVRAGRTPWWFSSSLNALNGRFDLPHPEGTCYLASDAMAALLEVVGPDLDGGVVSESLLSSRRLMRLALPKRHRLSNLTDRRASGFGVTAEIHTIVPYRLPQAWAQALRREGADGLLYHVRHDPSHEGLGVALFGKAGARRGWNAGREIPIADALQRKLYETCKIRVLPIPRASGLRVIES